MHLLRGAFYYLEGNYPMTAQYTHLEQIRLEKLETLRAEGIEPYPNRAERTHTSQEAIQSFEAAEAEGKPEWGPATLAGRIRSMRPMGKLTFAHIEDGDGKIQLFLRQNAHYLVGVASAAQ